MPVFAKPKYAGRSGDVGASSNRHTDEWLAVGYALPDEAVAAVTAVAPAKVARPDGTVLYQAGVRYQEAAEVDHGATAADAKSMWEVSVAYETASRILTEEGKVKVDYDTTGGTVHITQCPNNGESKAYAAPTETVPLVYGAIGVTEDGVDGVDITVPVFRFSATKVFKVEDLPAAGDLYRLTGKVNDAVLTVKDSYTKEEFTFQPGELKFGGARRQLRPDGLAEVTYEFEGSRNAKDLTIGSIAVAAKDGWDFLWVRYKTKVGGTGGGKMVNQEPQAVYVSRIYERLDLTPLKCFTT